MKAKTPPLELQQGWLQWVQTRPEPVRRIIETYGFAPWKVYRLKAGQRVIIHSFDECDGDPPITVTVLVSAELNLVVMERHVFGIKPEDIEECDLPEPDEKVGLLPTVEDFGISSPYPVGCEPLADGTWVKS